MSVGFPTSKTDIDARAGQLALQLRDTLRQIQLFEAYLVATPDATLITAGYIQAEVNTLKSAYSDLDQLRTIYEGGANLSVAKDFRTFAKLLVGSL